MIVKYHPMATWIFQGNPDIFDIEGYFAALGNGTALWIVRQRHLANRMAAGDHVFFWQAGAGEPKRAGVIASGTIEAPPEELALDEASLPFCRDTSLNGVELRVKVRID